MKDDLQFEGKNYISSRRAAQSCGYTQDYIGQLIRGKKIEARMIGRSWFVSEESLKNYEELNNPSLKEESLFSNTVLKTDVSLSNKAIIEKAQVNNPEVKPVSSFVYYKDDRPLLPQLDKNNVSPFIDFKSLASLPVEKKRNLREDFLEQISFTNKILPGISAQKIIAGALSLCIVVGSFWMSNIHNAKLAYQGVNKAHVYMGEIVDGVSSGVYQATEGFSNIYTTVAKEVGGFSGKDSLASITSLENNDRPEPGFFTSIGSGIQKSIEYVFGKIGTIAMSFFGGEEVADNLQPTTDNPQQKKLATKDGELVASGLLPEKRQTKESKLTTDNLQQEANNREETNDLQPTTGEANNLQPTTYNNQKTTDNVVNNYTVVSNADTEAVSKEILKTKEDLQNQINLIANVSSRALGSVRSSRDSNITEKINESKITNSTISGSSIGATDLSVSGASSLGGITFGNATGTNATTTNIYTDNLTAANITFTSSTVINATTSNSTTTNTYTDRFLAASATSTSLFASVFHAVSGVIDTLTSTLATITNLFTTNLTATNATSTYATSTTLFSTTASSTNLFSSLLNVGGNGLVVDSNRRVGIGTISPSQKLEVNGNVALTGSGFYSAGTNNWFGSTDALRAGGGSVSDLGLRTDGNLVFMKNGGNEYARFDTSGNLGIGTTNPTYKLVIFDSTNNGGFNFNANTQIISTTFGNGGSLRLGTTESTPGSLLGSNIFLGGSARGDGDKNAMRFLVDSTEFMRIDGDSTNHTLGNVGIGTTSPFTKLAVGGGDLAIDANQKLIVGGYLGQSYITYRTPGSTPGMDFYVGGNYAVTIDGSTQRLGVGSTTPWGQLGVTNPGAGPSFVVEDTASPDPTPFVIDTSGNVGVGTTNPGYTLEVNGNIASGGSSGVGQYRLLDGSGNLDWTMYENGSDLSFYDHAGVGNVVTLKTGGNVGIGTISPNAPLEVNGNIRNTSNTQSILTNNIDVISSSVAATLFNSTSNAAITIGTGITSGNIKIGPATGGITVLGSASSGNVGVGTTSPWGRLSVGSTNVLSGAPLFVIASSSSAVATTTPFIVTANGNVGVNVSNPSQKLGVVGNIGLIGSGSALKFESNGIGTPFFDISGDAGFLSFRTNTGSSDVNATAMVIARTTGNVGIGTTNPNSRLEITPMAGNVFDTGITIGHNQYVTKFNLTNIDSEAYLTSTGNNGVQGQFVFQTGTSSTATKTERLRIDNSGNVIIGGNYTLGLRRLTAVEGNGTGLQYTAQLVNNSTDAANTSTGILFTTGTGGFVRGKGGLIYNGDGTGWNRGDFYFLQNSGADANNPVLADSVMVIKNGGNVGVGTTSPWGRLSVGSANVLSGAPLFVIASSSSAVATTTHFIVTANGSVGIGTSTVELNTKLGIQGGNIVHKAAISSPVLLSNYNSGGTTHQVSVVGKIAYIANGNASYGLQILDVTNPSAPTLIGSSQAAGAISNLAVSGKYLYAGNSSGFYVFDVSNPVTPVLISTTAVSTHRIVVSGKYAYIISGSTLKILDISDPTAPTVLSTSLSMSQSYGLSVVGKYAYVNEAAMTGTSTKGLAIVDISNPSSPLLVSETAIATLYPSCGTSTANPCWALGNYVSGKYLYVGTFGGAFLVIDISNPVSPTLIGSLLLTAGTPLLHQIVVAGHYAYVGGHQGGFSVIDISNPASPTLVGTYDTVGSAGREGFSVSGKYAYVGDDTNGFNIFDVNGLDTPTISTGSIEANNVNVSELLHIGGDVSVGGGINAGLSGIFSRGPISAGISSTTATTSQSLLSIYAQGLVGVGTTSPWAQLSVNPNGITGPSFAIGSSTKTDFVVTNGGDVGVGINAPQKNLDISAVTPTLRLTMNNDNSSGAYEFFSTTTATTRYQIMNSNAALLFKDYQGTTIFQMNTQSGGATSAGSMTANNFIASLGTATSTFAGGATFATGGGNVGIGTSTPYGSGLFTVGTSSPLFYVDRISGNVSLGTTTSRLADSVSVAGTHFTISNEGLSGSARLNINGLNNADAQIRFYQGGVFQSGFYAGSSGGNPDGKIHIYAGGSDVMIVSPLRNIGIGTTSPYAKLSVASTDVASTTLALRPVASQTGNILDIYNTDGTLGSVITANGNVGIGTTSPFKNLSIESSNATTSIQLGRSGSRGVTLSASNTQVGGGNADVFTVSNSYGEMVLKYTNDVNSNTGASLTLDTMANTNGFGGALNFRSSVGTWTMMSTGGFDTEGADKLTFRKNGVSRMLIDGSTGNVGIGTTVPNYKLEVNGTASTTQLQLPNTTSSSVGGIYMGGTLTIHNYGSSNFFAGNASGNTAMLGSGNTAVGQGSLNGNTGGNSNVANGLNALLYNTSGSQNVGIGYFAGINYTNNIAQYRIVDDTNMTLVGFGATKNNVSTLTNGTAIGNGAFVLASNQVVLGNDNVTTTLLKGNVGIGATNPNALLNIAVSGQDLLRVDNTDDGRLVLDATGPHGQQISFTPRTSAGISVIQSNSGSLNLLDSQIYIGDSADTTMRVVQSSDEIMFNTGGAERMRLKGANFGIGTNNPLNKFVVSLGNNEIAQFNNGSNGSGVWGMNIGMISQNSEAQITTRGSPLVFYTGGTLNTMTVGTERMRIDNSTGNVGIGTANPNEKLQVNGDVRIRSGGYATSSLKFDDGVGERGLIAVNAGTGNSAFSFHSSYSIPFIFNVHSGEATSTDPVPEAARIYANSFLVGTTSSSYRFAIQGGSGGATPKQLILNGTTGDAVGISMSNCFTGSGCSDSGSLGPWHLYTGDNSSSNGSFYIGKGSSKFITMSSSGNVGVGTTTPTAQLHTTGTVRFSNFGAGTLTTDASGNVTASSDERLKNIEGNFTRGLTALSLINPITYRWNETSGYDQVSTYTGFSAQNIQAAIPEAVSIDPRGYLTLSDRPILAATVNAIKELNLSIETIMSRLSGIEARLASLETFVEVHGFASTSASTTIVYSNTPAIIQVISSWLSSLGIAFENGIARFVAIVSDVISTKKLTVGDSSNLAASGITILDRLTGNPACVYVENGVMKTEAGECGAVVPGPAPQGNEGTTSGVSSDIESTGGDSGGVISGDTNTGSTTMSGDTDQNGSTTPDVVENSETESSPDSSSDTDTTEVSSTPSENTDSNTPPSEPVI